MRSLGRSRPLALLGVLALIAAISAAPAAGAPPPDVGPARSDTALFFVGDGMRQDAIEKYVSQGSLPAMAELLKKGVSAADDGLLTQGLR